MGTFFQLGQVNDADFESGWDLTALPCRIILEAYRQLKRFFSAGKYDFPIEYQLLPAQLDEIYGLQLSSF